MNKLSGPFGVELLLVVQQVETLDGVFWRASADMDETELEAFARTPAKATGMLCHKIGDHMMARRPD